MLAETHGYHPNHLSGYCSAKSNSVRIAQMNLNKSMRMLLLTSCLGVGGSLLIAQQPSDQNAPAQADNTKMNRANEPTADQQQNSLSDRDLTQQIRKAIMKDKSLSTYAHNVKIITQNGQVTLKGPVRSDDEKRTIEAKAAEIAGANKVTSELAVKPKS
jgi:hyperosmotically inducible protein